MSAAEKWARKLQPGPAVIKERTIKRGVLLIPVSASDRKQILRELAAHVFHDTQPWTCYPSVERLVLNCSMSPRTVKRVLRSLIADGRISRRRPEYGAVMVTTLHPTPEELSTSHD